MHSGHSRISYDPRATAILRLQTKTGYLFNPLAHKPPVATREILMRRLAKFIWLVGLRDVCQIFSLPFLILGIVIGGPIVWVWEAWEKSK